ncbi:MAG TPA: PEP-CTERM sorting domain-containing protein [Bryobacteraceae bacterium]|nr:PEP-CTERM sorting domain-containing protein [Bryobacteraceae bacterium]
MKFFLLTILLASATTATASVTYDYHFQSNAFGTTDWQFTVSDFVSAPGTTFITSFDSYSSTFQGTPLFDIQITDPFTASPFISTDAMEGGLSSGGWTGPFDHAGTYTGGGNATLIITQNAASVPEPSSLALIGAAGMLLALVRRRGLVSRIQTS